MAATPTAILIQAAILSAPTAPPAPPAPPSPPRIYTVAMPQGSMPVSRERYVVDVEVRAGGEVLWSGPITVAYLQPTSFSRRLAEPAPDDCGTVGYGQQLENTLSVQLSLQRGSNGETAVGVAVRWGRSLPGACPYRSSSRSVELNQTVTLAPGRAVVLNGDADLTVRLRRR